MPFKRIVRNAFRNVRRGGWFTLTSLLVMTLTFFVTSIFIIAAYLSNEVLTYLESKAQITAFFKDSASEEQILKVKDSLYKSGYVSEVSYVSKEDALKIYMGQHKDEPLLLESISSDIFPASLNVRAKDINDLPTVAGMLEKTDGVEEVVYYKDVISTFERWSRTSRIVGLVLVGILSVISILVVLVTISSAIHAKREEIIVMRLVGASDWYIRGPYLIQGAFYGFFAAIFSTILISILYPLLFPYIRSVFQGISISPFSVWLLPILLFVEIVFGVALGVFGSLFAMRKYLKL